MCFNCLWDSPCYIISNVKVGVLFVIGMQLFMNFTMLCNYLWISPCFAIICECQTYYLKSTVDMGVPFVIGVQLWISLCCAIIYEFYKSVTQPTYQPTNLPIYQPTNLLNDRGDPRDTPDPKTFVTRISGS